MSEAVPGLPLLAAPAARPRDAAVTVLYRQGGNGPEVFWVRREKRLSFGGGFYAFPGGRLDRADSELEVHGAQGQEAAFVACAARELFEEAGVLVAQGPPPSEVRLAEARKALLEERRTFAQVLGELGLSLDAKPFWPAGRWITPPYLPVRFDARFFLVEAPSEAHAEAWAGEIAEAEWIRPQEALARWAAGQALLHPPNLHALQVMAGFSTPALAARQLADPPYCPGFIASRLEFQQGILLFPLETPTLPPATHTNSYVLGNGELLIVDPGSAEVRQYARLLALISGLSAEGRRPKAVFLTHHHADHVGGALAVKARLKIPLWCHERTAERLPPGAADRLLVDGEVIDLAGLPPMRLTVLHTPGHARGHLCLWHEASGAAVVGDMVAGVGTIVIDPPEGDMAEYLVQLTRLKQLPVGTLYPAHGPAIPDGPGKLSEYLVHRAQRECRVLEALGAAGATLRELVPVAYADTPEVMHPLAERSAQAILIKLARDGRVTRREDRYFAVP
jgi:endoribonuclease LACTB2